MRRHIFYLFIISLALLLPKNALAYQSWRGYVVADKLNVRSGPGTDYKVMFTILENYEVFVIGEQNTWYEIKNGNSTSRRFWVSKEYIKHKVVVEELPETIIVKRQTDKANVPQKNRAVHKQNKVARKTSSFLTLSEETKSKYPWIAIIWLWGQLKYWYLAYFIVILCSSKYLDWCSEIFFELFFLIRRTYFSQVFWIGFCIVNIIIIYLLWYNFVLPANPNRDMSDLIPFSLIYTYGPRNIILILIIGLADIVTFIFNALAVISLFVIYLGGYASVLPILFLVIPFFAPGICVFLFRFYHYLTTPHPVEKHIVNITEKQIEEGKVLDSDIDKIAEALFSFEEIGIPKHWVSNNYRRRLKAITELYDEKSLFGEFWLKVKEEAHKKRVVQND